MKKQKIIHDSIYGSIKLGEMVSDIISTREFQRLNSVKQLGFSYLVFPGATHTRFEHSLGTYYLTYEAARNLELEQEDIEAVMEKGLPAMEGLMLARMLMYRTVYRHRTSLVASVLANNALEIISPPLEEFVGWNDYDFMAEMKKNEKTRDIYDMLKFRNLPSGLTLNMEEKNFDDIVSGIMDKITYHKYFKSPYKREVVKILVRGEMKPITEESGIMEYLERELTGTGLLVFDKSNGDYIKKYLDKQDVKYQ